LTAQPEQFRTAKQAWIWLPAVAWAAFIATLTSIPGSKMPRQPFIHFDLIVHAAVYAALGFLAHRAFFRGTSFTWLGRAWVLPLFLGLVYAALDEIHQTWIPGRSCALEDFIADGLGAALGVWVYFSRFARPGRR